MREMNTRTLSAAGTAGGSVLRESRVSENRREMAATAAVRDEFRRELLNSRSVLLSPGSSQTDILSRLQKAKTAFDFMKSDVGNNSSNNT